MAEGGEDGRARVLFGRLTPIRAWHTPRTFAFTEPSTHASRPSLLLFPLPGMVFLTLSAKDIPTSSLRSGSGVFFWKVSLVHVLPTGGVDYPLPLPSFSPPLLFSSLPLPFPSPLHCACPPDIASIRHIGTMSEARDSFLISTFSSAQGTWCVPGIWSLASTHLLNEQMHVNEASDRLPRLPEILPSGRHLGVGHGLCTGARVCVCCAWAAWSAYGWACVHQVGSRVWCVSVCRGGHTRVAGAMSWVGAVEVSGFLGALRLCGLCSDLCFLLMLLQHDCAHTGLLSGWGPEFLHL